MVARALTILGQIGLSASCASTRYEEYGDVPAPEVIAPGETVVESVVVSDRDMLEAQIKGLETRLVELDNLIQARIDQLDQADGTLSARVAALSEQVQELHRQLQSGTAAAPKSNPAPTAAAPTMSVNALYEHALQAFDKQQYGDAKPKFEEILRRTPSGPLADNAQYWIGECAYAVEDYTGALDAFKLVFNYADTEKDDDAQLKLGYAFLKLRDLDSALIEFKRLTVDYPDSEYIPRAEEQIRRIRAAKASAP